MQLLDALTRFLRRLAPAAERSLQRLRSFSRGPTRWIALLIALGLFGLQCVLAVRNLPDTQLSWPPMVALVTIGTLLNLAANGVEYRLAAGSLGQRPRFAATMRISFLSSASNLLPIPGSILVRSASLRAGGAGYRQLGAAMGGQGVAFLSVTGLTAGAILIPTGTPVLGTAALVTGVFCAGASARFMSKVTDRPFVWAARLMVGELFVVAVTAVRIWAAASVLGERLTPGAVAALTVASVAATATGIFPGGLGIREAFSGAVSPLVGLPVSFGILIGAVDRVAFLIGLGLIGAVLALTPHGRRILRGADIEPDVAQEPEHAAPQ
jgi:hypothetical protein